MAINKLWGMRAYLIGAMDRVPDGGVKWREDITPFLESLGIVVLNPCAKPISIGFEDVEDRERRKNLKSSDNYEQLAEEVRLLRVVDLRMTDMSDFLIVNLDVDTHMCGSYEETSWANRLKRPILIVVKQGKAQCPDWLLGMIPHEHIFNTFDDMKEYLSNVNSGLDTRHFKRWMFFEYQKMLPKVPFGDEPFLLRGKE